MGGLSMKRLFCFVMFMITILVFAQITNAAPITYIANLDGSNQSPANASPGTGFATVIYDSAIHTMEIDVSFNDLLGVVTASHIHAATALPFDGTAGVATTTPTFAGFPIGVTSGAYDIILDMTLTSSWNPAFVTANGGSTASAEAAFATAMAGGKAYFNIHTTQFPGGEIRGFLTTSVPEPATMLLLVFGLIGLMGARRKLKE